MKEALIALRDSAIERFGDSLFRYDDFRGDLVLQIQPEELLNLLAWLKKEASPSFDLLSDISAVDGLNLGRSPRFRVAYQLLSTEAALRLRVEADASEEGEIPVLPSATGLWEAADWDEREIWDLMGIHFEGHPDLRRILLHEDYDRGHPLRKEVPTRGRDNDNL